MSIEASHATAQTSGAPATLARADASSARRAFLVGWLADILAAAVITYILLLWSFRHGRLLFYPQFDDVAYMRMSLYRLNLLQQGLATFFRAYYAGPPHAPFTEIFGMFSYMIFGRHDWAPYAGNGALLLVVLRMMRHLLPNVPAPYRWLTILIVVSTRVVDELIVEVRPDLFYGLLLAFSVVWIISRPLVTAKPLTWLNAGALFGALLFIKTSVYPQTLAFLCLVLGIRTICDLIDGRWRLPIGRTILAWIVVVATAIIIVVPHYAIAFDQINSYIYDTIFGVRKNFWRYQGGFLKSLMYYIIGVGGEQMLGRRIFLLIPLLFVLLYGVFKNTSNRKRLELTALCMVFFASYALPTMNQTKSAFLGVGFQSMWLMLILYLVNELFTIAPNLQWSDNNPRNFSVVAALLAIALFSWPSEPGEGSTAIPRNSIATQLFPPLQTYYKNVDTPVLIMTTTGPMINGELFDYLALRDDNKVIRNYGDPYDFDPDKFRTMITWADFVIASENNDGEADPTMPTTLKQDETLALVRQCDELRQVASVTTYTGGHYFLFARDGLVPDKYEPFSGFWSVTGLGELEGPYPAYKLPAVRCGYAPLSEVDFGRGSTGECVAIVSVQAELPNQVVTVQLNGKTLTQFDASEGGFFRHVIHLPAQEGTNRLQFSYAVHENADVNPKAIIFRRLQILSADEFNRRYAFETEEPPPP